MRGIIIFLVLACLASASFAEVGRINVVGVDNQGNGMVIPMEVELVPGKGRILITSVPFTGVDTQASENTAVAAALNFTGQELGDRDIIFVFNTNITLVEGPSAGAAMALGAISALEHLSVREDVVVSGLVSERGDISISGALLQKAYASRDENLFLVGPGGNKIAATVSRVVEDDGILMSDVDPVVIDLEEYADRHWGLKVLEVHNLSEAADIVFSAPEEERAEGNWSFELKNRVSEDNALYRSAVEFSEIGWGLVRELDEAYNGTELEEPRTQLEKSKEYLENGYEYPAANQAFLAVIGLRTLRDQHYKTNWTEIQPVIGREIEIPYYGTPLHYVVGAQERYSWAQNVAELIDEEPGDVEQIYFNANLVRAWLEIVDNFLAEAEPEEMVFSSEIVKKLDYWEELAGEEIAADNALGIDSQGAESLYNAVQTDRANGWYYAAVYDAINAAGRAASGDVSKYEAVKLIERAERSVKKATDKGVGFWAENYLENSMVAFDEGKVEEAYMYAFMAEEYAKFDLYAHGIQVVEPLPEPVAEKGRDGPEIKSFWGQVCEILGRWCPIG